MKREQLSDRSEQQIPIRRRWSLAIGITFAAMGLAFAGHALSRLPGQPVEKPVSSAPLPVAVIRLQPQPTYDVQRVFVGRVEATRRSAVGFELGGLLQQVAVDEGDTVAQDQLLARLDTKRLKAQRQELQAALAATQADQALAKITLKRFERVVKSGGVTRQGLDEARESYRAAQAGVTLAQSRIATIDVELNKSELLSPFAAKVVRRYVDEGRVLNAAEPVLELIEHPPAEIRIGIAGRLVDTVQVGQRLTVELNEQSVPTRVKALLPVRGPDTRTVDVLLTLEDKSNAVRAGDLARLTLSKTVSEPGYWLPLDALSEGPRGLWTVYRLEPAGESPEKPLPQAEYEVVPLLVEILHQESDRVFTQGALPDNALIVAGGLHRIVPGQLVRIDQRNDHVAANGKNGHVVN
ncbi:MAG: efflux RND transporter periplasmic adaptor subunit [Candidatus Competibacteraceae bacterium]|nr:efflux RND transporter periplasmic adaptor subunit [Candidatus Competibacteraceae bacterium]